MSKLFITGAIPKRYNLLRKRAREPAWLRGKPKIFLFAMFDQCMLDTGHIFKNQELEM